VLLDRGLLPPLAARFNIRPWELDRLTAAEMRQFLALLME
jgi:hypothetical protein